MSFTVTAVTNVPPWRPTELKYKYEQLADHLEARIKAGELQPGRRLPPERELAETYEVAFHTVRRAMQILRDRGLVTTLHGHGNYVSMPEDG